MKAITVCVGSEYADLLAVTIPYNIKHFEKVLIVTSKEDVKTETLVRSMPYFPDRIQLFKTDAFTSYGAIFNKGLAIEEAFDVIGRSGWMCVFDADILLPSSTTLLSIPILGIANLKEYLYSAYRRVLYDPTKWGPDLDWNTLSVMYESRPTTFPGYFHLFHADAKALKDPGLPWYDVCYSHAGGGDGFFQSRWPKELKCRILDPVLHLGPRNTNWFGTTEKARQEMSRYHRAKGWIRGVPADPIYQERVSIPGHKPLEWVYKPGQ